MAATKDYFEKLMENQNKLVSSLTDYANEVVDVTMPTTKVTEKMEVYMKDCVAAYLDFAEEMSKKENLDKFQEDFWGAMTEQYNKNIKFSTDMYKKTMECMRDLWSTSPIDNQQEKMQQFTEFYQNYWKTCVDVTKENTKVMQDFFNESAKSN